MVWLGDTKGPDALDDWLSLAGSMLLIRGCGALALHDGAHRGQSL